MERYGQAYNYIKSMAQGSTLTFLNSCKGVEFLKRAQAVLSFRLALLAPEESSGEGGVL